MGARMDKAKQMEEAIDASATIVASLRNQVPVIAEICEVIVGALQQGHTVLTAGNGGSAAEALHMSEELVGRYRGDRRPLPAVCLAADGTALTCISNDFGYGAVFERQVQALGREGDVLVLFSTSGTGDPLERALAAGTGAGVTTICLLGRDGGALAGRADHELIVPGDATERIQEAHQVVVHLILDAVQEVF